jgi:hypothetical protein
LKDFPLNSLPERVFRFNYFMSGVYNNQQGVYLNNSSAFYADQVNLDIKAGNRVKIGEQIYAWQRNTRPVDYGGPLGSSLR